MNTHMAAVLTYPKLLAVIKSEIDKGRRLIQKTQAETYWNVGRFIAHYVLRGADRAQYGERIYQQLSKDLAIHADTLEQAVRFSKEFSISDARRKLTWTHYRTLLSLPDRSIRRRLIKKSLTEKLSSRQLQKEVVRHKIIPVVPDGPIPQLKVERGQLFTYKVIAPPSMQPVEGHKFVDCGFDIWRQVPLFTLGKFDDGAMVESLKIENAYKIRSSNRAKKDLYTFKATVERIVDGDTLIVHADCGFETWTRQYLRFRGINVPELSTKEGQAAKRFIEARIKPNDFVVIKTHWDDKYGRYLVDVWYAPSIVAGQQPWDEAKVAAEGIYLNQELLDNRLAVKW